MSFTENFDVVTTSFQQVWLDVFSAVPRIIGAILVFLIGWAVAMAIGKIISSIAMSLKLDEGLGKLGMQDGLARAGLRLDSAKFLGELFQVLLYIPNVIVAVIMIIAALLLAGFFEKLVHASVETAHLKGGKSLGLVVKWVVLVFGFLAAVQQLGVATDIINIMITGFVAMVALAGGIAFGIAGKDVAGDILKKAKALCEEEKK